MQSLKDIICEDFKLKNKGKISTIIWDVHEQDFEISLHSYQWKNLVPFYLSIFCFCAALNIHCIFQIYNYDTD